MFITVPARATTQFARKEENIHCNRKPNAVGHVSIFSGWVICEKIESTFWVNTEWGEFTLFTFSFLLPPFLFLPFKCPAMSV